MDVGRLAEALCGGCSEDIPQLLDFFKGLEREAAALAGRINLEAAATPLVKAVPREVLAEEYGRMPSKRIAKYVIRRALYLKYGNSVKPPAGLRCPICGLPPTLLIERREDLGIFSRDVYYARCTCGYEWRWENPYLCPKCGAIGRENFIFYMSGDFGVYFARCKACGFTVAVSEQEVDPWEHVVLQLLAKYVG